MAYTSAAPCHFQGNMGKLDDDPGRKNRHSCEFQKLRGNPGGNSLQINGRTPQKLFYKAGQEYQVADRDQQGPQICEALEQQYGTQQGWDHGDLLEQHGAAELAGKEHEAPQAGEKGAG